MIKGQPWTKGKSFDTFTPVGPCIVTGLDLDNIPFCSSLNGFIKQEGNTFDMIFNIRKLIAYVSSIMTLNQGDLIITGTPLGASEVMSGDVVECSSPYIGSLKNRVK